MNRRLPSLIILSKVFLFSVCVTGFTFQTTFAELQITEFMAVADSDYPDANGVPSDWIEITNSGVETASLNGYFLTNNANNLTKWTFSDVELAPGTALVVFASGRATNELASDEQHTNFTLDRGGDYLALIAPDGVTAVSEIAPTYPAQYEGISYGIGIPESIARETLVARDADGKYFIPTDDSLGDLWTKSPAEFDDSGWISGSAGFGFETARGALEALINTNISSAMRSVNGSGYFRFPFQFDTQDRQINSLQLSVHIDDGFVAYLNGVEIARFQSPPDLQWNSTASGSRLDQITVDEAIVIDVSAFRSAIKNGENVLAIQGMNSSTNNSDFVIDAELLADVRDTSGGLQYGFLEEPTPGETNSTIKSTPPDEIVFSVTSRLFTEDFLVELSNATPNSIIRYTTDLSLPTNDLSNPSPLYTGPIEITASTQIRAQAFRNGSLDGPVRTETFLRMSEDVPTFSSNLPVVIFSTLGTGPPPGTSATTRKEAFMFFYEPDPETGRTVLTQSPAITTRAGIRRRGSSSGIWPKWSLSVETWRDGDDEDRDIAPLGMPVEADWILSARYEFDLALMRNPFVYEASRQIGRYAPRTKFIEVFADTTGSEISDSDYFGVYSLIEKIERDNDRVDIARIDPWENSEPELTGGYIFKNDRPDPGEPVINVSGMGQITLVDPDGGEATGIQRSWLTSHLNEVDRALRNAPSGINILTGLHFSDYIDVDSWIDHHMLNIMSLNIDWGRHSAFFHKDRNGKIVSGPVWDYDRALGCEDVRDNNPLAWEGVVNAVGTVSSKTWFDSRFPWYGHLLGPTQDPGQANYPDVRQRHTDRWAELRKREFSIENLHDIIDSMAGEIRESQVRNFERWTQYPPNGGNFADPDLTGWEAEVSHMKNWLVARLEWVDSQYLTPPAFNNPGGIISPGFELAMNSPDGQIFYTIDGSDPRESGGQPSDGSILFLGGPVDEILIDVDSSGRYLIPSDDSLGLSWTGVSDLFDDTSWQPAINGVGFESTGGITELISTDISEEMKSVNASCYFRLPFEFNNTENLNSLTLTVWADDGFVAYLNGTEVGSLLKPTPLLWNSTTDGGGGFPGGDTAVLNSPIIIDLTPFKDQMQDGPNVIALHGLNSSPGGSDFLLRALLSVNHTIPPTPVTISQTQVITARTFNGSQWSAPEQIALIISDELAAPSNLVISEIMYRPTGPNESEIAAGFNQREEFEFLELRNISDTPVALAGMLFSDGIDFDFNDSLISLLHPGEHALLVKNRAAFELRYGNARSPLIIGEFQNGTKLKNEGERLAITTFDGNFLRNFEYDNNAPWPVAPGIGGYSLILAEPETNPDHSIATNWILSSVFGGSPGTADQLDFETWAAAFGNPAPDSDLDTDGRVALLEYAMATNPSISDPADTPLEINEVLKFSFRKNALANDITYSLEQSSDLENWAEADHSITLIEEVENMDGTITMVYRSDSPNSDNPQFLRMRVTLN